MDDELLSEILVVEREIEARLAAERRQAGEMLIRLEQELAAEASREEERLAAAGQDERAAARLEAMKQAAAIVRRAAECAKQQAALDDAFLAGIIMNHLARIMPEQDR